VVVLVVDDRVRQNLDDRSGQVLGQATVNPHGRMTAPCRIGGTVSTPTGGWAIMAAWQADRPSLGNPGQADTYVNIHTKKFGDGEIRGQIRPHS
jgi:hypothetical protein